MNVQHAGNELLDGFTIGLALLLLLLGLSYRLWRWITTPDEATARKLAARREQLRQIARRPAKDVPTVSNPGSSEPDDPALNSSEVR